MLTIFIDADGCAVKEEVYKVSSRYSLKVIVVANQNLRIPTDSLIIMKVVSGGFDAADDWIAETIEEADILVTSDLLLADRCIQKKARVIGPKGNELNEENIGNILGARELSAHLRHFGDTKTGPAPMGKMDRSRFLSTLDQVIHSIKKKSQ